MTDKPITAIGGSESAAALGLDPFRTGYELYVQKTTGAESDIDPELSFWGNADEPAIVQRYERDTGRKIVQRFAYKDAPLIHPQHPWMRARPDGITDDQRIAEWKISNLFGVWGDDLPERVMIQIQHNMAVTGIKVADVAVRMGLYQFRIYQDIEADAELQELIIEGEQQFLKRVEELNPPEPNWEHPSTRAIFKKAYPGTTGEILTADAQLEQWYTTYLEATEKAKSYESSAEAAKNHMLFTMGEAAVLKFAAGKELRRKLTKRKGYTVADSEYVDTRFVKTKE